MTGKPDYDRNNQRNTNKGSRKPNSGGKSNNQGDEMKRGGRGGRGRGGSKSSQSGFGDFQYNHPSNYGDANHPQPPSQVN